MPLKCPSRKAPSNEGATEWFIAAFHRSVISVDRFGSSFSSHSSNRACICAATLTASEVATGLRTVRVRSRPSSS